MVSTAMPVKSLPYPISVRYDASSFHKKFFSTQAVDIIYDTTAYNISAEEYSSSTSTTLDSPVTSSVHAATQEKEELQKKVLPIIEFQNWTYRTPDGFTLKDINFSINPGEHVLIMGASGTGKSTLLQSICGIPTADEEEVEGKIILRPSSSFSHKESSEYQKPSSSQPSLKLSTSSEAPHQSTILHRDHQDTYGSDTFRASATALCSLVLQNPQAQMIFDRVGDTIAFGLENQGADPHYIWEKVRAVLKRVGLGYLPLDYSTQRLSGGQMQRVAIAGAISENPQILLLDEPLSSLDPSGADEVVESVAQEMRDSPHKTLIIADHHADKWMSLINRVIILQNESVEETHNNPSYDSSSQDNDELLSWNVRVVADGSPQEVFESNLDFQKLGIWAPSQFAQLSQVSSFIANGIDGKKNAKPLSTDDFFDENNVRDYARSTTSIDLKAENLTYGYKSAVIQKNISCSFYRNTFAVITGENGTGKTSLALTLAGFMKPISGDVVASERIAPSYSVHPYDWKASDLVTRIGYVFQNPEYEFIATTVEAEIRLALSKRDLHKKRFSLSEKLLKGEDEVGYFLRKVGLERYRYRSPYQLSGGEKRRLSILCGIIPEPAILILDEPTFGQDRLSWNKLVNLLKDIVKQGVTVIAISHDLELIKLASSEVHLRADFHQRFSAFVSEFPSFDVQNEDENNGEYTRYRQYEKDVDNTHEVEEHKKDKESERDKEDKRGKEDKYKGDNDDVTQKEHKKSQSFIDTLNPVSRLGGAFIFSIPLYVSLNIVSASVALGAALIGLLLMRVPLKRIAVASIPVLLIVPWTFLAIFLYGKSGGTVYFQWGFFLATERSLYLALSTSIRMVAIALPSIVLALGIDPTYLADSCAQILKLPSSIVYGGLAGLRVFVLLPSDWTIIRYARRARGAEYRWKVANFPAQVFSLLVQSLRRAELMSIALTARGFSPHQKRTYARVASLRVRDWVFLVLSACIPIAALLAAYYTGYFQWG